MVTGFNNYTLGQAPFLGGVANTKHTLYFFVYCLSRLFFLFFFPFSLFCYFGFVCFDFIFYFLLLLFFLMREHEVVWQWR